MTVSIAVCGHHSRKEIAEALGDKLSAPISWDDGAAGILRNHDNAMQLAATDADWVIVIEDDAEPVPDFREQAALALDVVDGSFASLYFGYVGQPRRRVTLALDRNDPHWVMKPGFTSAVCIAVRTDMVHPLLYTVDPWDFMTVDERYSAGARQLGQRWIPHSHPSLVEHSDIPGVEGACGIPRRAYRVGQRAAWSNTQLRFHERVWE